MEAPPAQIVTARSGSSAGEPGPDRAVAPLLISVFHNECDKVPARKETSWAQLVESLAHVTPAACVVADCARKTCLHKKIRAWSPAYWPAGYTREQHTVEAVSCFVIDLDHVPPVELEPHLERLGGYAYVLHSSHSDRPDDRCVRVVLQLSRPIPGPEFSGFWRAAVDQLGIPADEATKDTGRLYFLPSRPLDACEDIFDGSGFDYAENAGAPIDVDAMLALVPKAQPRDPAPVLIPIPAFRGAPTPQDFTAAAQALGEAWPGRGRHGAQLALAGALTRAGWPVELVAEFCAAVAEVQEPGSGLLEKRLAAARSSASKLAAGDAVVGWPRLEEHVGKDAVHAATRALRIVMPDPDPEFAATMTRSVEARLAKSIPIPTPSDIRSHLVAASRSRSTRPEAIKAAALIKRVLKPYEIAADERELCEVAFAVVHAVPDGTTLAQISEVLLTFAGRFTLELDEIVSGALTKRDADKLPPETSGTVATATNYVREHRTASDGVTLRRCQGVWYSWSRDVGCYRELSDEELQSNLYRKLNLGSKHEVADVAHALIAVDDVLIPQMEIGGWLDDTALDRYDVAACRNGLLHLPTMTLRPATPAYFCTTTLGVGYAPDAAQPKRWLRFLSEVFPGDKESIATLQEFFGYLLTPDSRQQKIFLLWGGKRSGKGTVGRVLDALLGDGNVVSPTLTSLGSQFGLQPLIGRLAAVIRDARLGGRADATQVLERLLSISGQDQQTIDRKNRMAWTGTLIIRFAILTNELPKVPDPSGALAGRIILLRFGQCFYGREDQDLTDALLQELPGILRWAAAGWTRLRARGRFVQPASSGEYLDTLQDLGDPVGAWVRECCTIDPALSVTKGEARDSYLKWCAIHDEKPGSRSEFGRDLSSAGYMSSKAPRDAAGKRAPVYTGLALRGPGGPGDT